MTQHPTQDSQSELRNAIEAYKRYPYGTKEFPHITGIELLEVVEAYVTTRVKEAERLARIDGQLSLVQIIIQEWLFNFPDDDDFTNWLFNKQSKLEALTTTTNGKDK